MEDPSQFPIDDLTLYRNHRLSCPQLPPYSTVNQNSMASQK